MKQRMTRDDDYSRLDMQDLEELLAYYTTEIQKEEDKIKILQGYIDEIKKDIETYKEAIEFEKSSIEHYKKNIAVYEDNAVKYEQVLTEMRKLNGIIDIFEKTGTHLESTEQFEGTNKKNIGRTGKYITHCEKKINRYAEEIRIHEKWISQYSETMGNTEGLLTADRFSKKKIQGRMDELRCGARSE